MGSVAQVAPDLADHGGHGVGDERAAAAPVEAVDGLDQPHSADLGEVLELLAVPDETGGKDPDQRKVPLDQDSPRLDVPPVAPCDQQLLRRCRHHCLRLSSVPSISHKFQKWNIQRIMRARKRTEIK